MCKAGSTDINLETFKLITWAPGAKLKKKSRQLGTVICQMDNNADEIENDVLMTCRNQFFGYYGYCKEIRTSDFVCGATMDD